MGGEVALNFARQNPQRVAGLILIDSSGPKVEGTSSLAPGYLLIPVVGRVLTALALTSDKLVREGLEKSFYDRSKITDERVAAYYRPLQTRGGQLAALRARTQADQFPIEPDLGKIYPGMAATIAVDSFPKRGFEGWIGFISPVAEFTPKAVQTEELRTSLVYEVRVFVEDPKDELRLGMPASVYFPLNRSSRRAVPAGDPNAGKSAAEKSR